MKNINPPTLQESCKIAARKHGGDAVKSVLQKYSPTGTLADLPETAFAACAAALGGLDNPAADSDPGYDIVYIPEPPADEPEPWQTQEHVGAGARNLSAEVAPAHQPDQTNAAALASDSLRPDLEQAARFVEVLTGNSEAVITVQTFSDNEATKVIGPTGKKHDPLAKIMHGTLAKLAPKLTEFNQQGAGIFICVNETNQQGRKAENIIGVRSVWGDFDGAGALAAALAAAEKLPPSIMVESSPGKRHEYWLADGVTIAGFRPLIDRLTVAIGSDPGARTIERVLRIPGFFHSKNAPVMVRLIATHPERRYTAEQIVTAFGLDALPTDDAKPQDGATDGDYDAFAAMPDPFWTLDRMQQVLRHIEPNLKRLKWRIVGFACYHQLGPETGLRVWQAWSRGDLHGFNKPDNYNAAAFEAEWETIEAEVEKGNGFSIGTMLALASEEVIRAIRCGGVANAPGDGEIKFMPLHIPSDTSNPLGNFFRTAPQPFPVDCVPKVLRVWAENQAAASGFDAGAYLYVALMAFSGWLDQRSNLQVRQGYQVPAFQWAGLADDSGGGKSPVLNAANSFIERLNAELLKASLAALGFIDGDAPDGTEPRLRQRIIVDATVEAIAEIASTNPEGLMYLADDVSAWTGKMDAYGGTGKDRGFYLGLNDRKENHPINRKGKKPIFVESLSGGMIVGMQPSVVVAQMKNGGTDDGLFQRFLLYTMAPAGRADFEAVIDKNLDTRVLDLFRAGFAAGQVNVKFTDAARKLAEEYLNAGRFEQHTNKLSRSHANKLIGYTFRLSLALHVLNCLAEGHPVSPQVGPDTLGAAADIITCLRSHAFNIYEMVSGGKVLSMAQYALEHIVANKVTEFTQSDLSRNNSDWAITGRFNTDHQEALDILWDRGVIANAGFSTGGRRAIVWKVNPKLLEMFAATSEELTARRKFNHEHLLAKFEIIRKNRDEDASH